MRLKNLVLIIIVYTVSNDNGVELLFVLRPDLSRLIDKLSLIFNKNLLIL